MTTVLVSFFIMLTKCLAETAYRTKNFLCLPVSEGEVHNYLSCVLGKNITATGTMGYRTAVHPVADRKGPGTRYPQRPASSDLLPTDRSHPK
jgi:hypothetical protein